MDRYKWIRFKQFIKHRSGWYWAQEMVACKLLKRHKWWLMAITDGRMSVRCRYCAKRREPTPEEQAKHPHTGWSKERQDAYNAEIEEVQRRLDDYLRRNPNW